MIDHLYPGWKTQEPQPLIAASVLPPSRVADTKLADAVLQALRTPNVHRMSPGWAVQAIYRETKDLKNNAADWVLRFLKMEPSEYSVRWNVSIDTWDIQGVVEFSGRDIANMCAYWVANGFQFDKHNVEHLPNAEGSTRLSEKTGECSLQVMVDELRTMDFPLPLSDQALRYVWIHERDGHVFQRSLVILCVESYATYAFVIEEEDIQEPIAFSEHPVSRYLLELQLYAGLLPITASAPYLTSLD
jgi:hypothetical protein